MSPESLGREAWEELAPELPPGWSVFWDHEEADNAHQDPPDDAWWFPISADTTHLDATGDTREEAVDQAWEAFGITRKQYTEDIAIRLVREAAGALDVRVGWTSGGVGIELWDGGRGFSAGYHEGATLCAAALACIRALETQS